MKNLLLIIAIAVLTTSCKKENIVPIVPQYAFKQTVYLWQDAYGDQTGTYPVFTYRVAVMADVHIDSVALKLTVILNDSTKILLTSNDLVNFAQTGFYAPDYEYPVYWIATLSDSKGICSPFYNFSQEDVCRFEYETTVKIGGIWYAIPKEERKKTDPFESFWI